MKLSRLSVRSVSLLAILSLAPGALAQQFSYQPGLIPGPSVWTEGVQAVDVDKDGDLDLCFSNGDGFASAGTQRQASLIINQRVETGSLSFTDESVARLGVAVANGKGVTAGDVNGDGWVDLLYLNAFNTDTPFLFINRGAAQPGFFDLESASRGFTENLSSAGAQFGDLDDDGDLDVIINDSGNSFLSGGGRPRLFFNDGTGHFTENATAMNAPLKAAHMDVQLVDLDGDWTVDFFGANRSSNSGGTHYVMLNNGSGFFQNVSGLLPNTSGSVYEAEVGDLDGDTDVDLYFVSLTGFQEGPSRNNLVETGTFGFVHGTPETGSVDDNEVALMDYDNDGDLDVFIGSLGSRERLYRNDGSLNFIEQSTQIQAVGDSTLDMTLADLDLDGDYDMITAQGESNSAQYVSKVYLNSGPADTTDPVIIDQVVPTALISWPAVFKIKFQDSVLDDGVDYVTSKAFAARQLGTGATTDWSSVFTPNFVSISAGQSVIINNLSTVNTITLECSSPVPFSAVIPPSGSYERVFVREGSYTVTNTSNGSNVIVSVAAGATEVDGLPMGVGQHRLSIPSLGTDINDKFAVEISLTDYAGNATWQSTEDVDFPMGGVERYCSPAASNTAGMVAALDWSGSFVVADQNFTLTASGMPTGEFGIFLVGTDRGFVPMAGGTPGNLCVGGAIGRFNDISQIQNSGATGSFTMQIPLNAFPLNPTQMATSGSTYTFQAWYRDSLLFPTANFTDALSVTFQ